MAKPGKSRAPKLDDEQRAFLVQRVACYDGPKDAAAALKEEFGVEITPQAVEAYDPNKRAGRNLSKRWRELFEKTREEFLSHVEKHVPVANKAVRVKELYHGYLALKSRGNVIAAADMLERISKELGGAYTNRRELTGKDGGPIETVARTPEEVDEALRQKMSKLGITLDGLTE